MNAAFCFSLTISSGEGVRNSNLLISSNFSQFNDLRQPTENLGNWRAHFGFWTQSRGLYDVHRVAPNSEGLANICPGIRLRCSFAHLGILSWACVGQGVLTAATPKSCLKSTACLRFWNPGGGRGMTLGTLLSAVGEPQNWAVCAWLGDMWKPGGGFTLGFSSRSDSLAAFGE